jgi:molybdenum cofactor synthesis domain-containing protein
LTIPDDQEIIVETVNEWSDTFDVIVVTGGLGGTHDDVTLDAVASAFDRDIVTNKKVLEDAKDTVDEYRHNHPEAFEESDLDLDYEAWSSVPEDCEVLLNPEGLTPGWILENVYAFPGVPDELKAMFELVIEDFDGSICSKVLLTDQPEGTMSEELAKVQDQFDVSIGSYPSSSDHNQIKILGTKIEEVQKASDYLTEKLALVD